MNKLLAEKIINAATFEWALFVQQSKVANLRALKILSSPFCAFPDPTPKYIALIQINNKGDN
jgi:hypothetical protein